MQGWGCAQLFTPEQAIKHPCRKDALQPNDPAFTFDYFSGLFDSLPPDDARSVKYFIISQPGAKGVANGYLQDVLFRAGLHPRTRAVDVTARQRRSLHKALATTIQQAIRRNGRDDEFDLFGKPGGYHRILSAEAAGKPCPQCGKRIVKESFLGGAIYFCPACQPAPARTSKKKKARAQPA